MMAPDWKIILAGLPIILAWQDDGPDHPILPGQDDGTDCPTDHPTDHLA